MKGTMAPATYPLHPAQSLCPMELTLDAWTHKHCIGWSWAADAPCKFRARCRSFVLFNSHERCGSFSAFAEVFGHFIFQHFKVRWSGKHLQSCYTSNSFGRLLSDLTELFDVQTSVCSCREVVPKSDKVVARIAFPKHLLLQKKKW
jgi:hypothetical protein